MNSRQSSGAVGEHATSASRAAMHSELDHNDSNRKAVTRIERPDAAIAHCNPAIMPGVDRCQLVDETVREQGQTTDRDGNLLSGSPNRELVASRNKETSPLVWLRIEEGLLLVEAEMRGQIDPMRQEHLWHVLAEARCT